MAAESSTPGELSQDGVIGDAGAANRLRGGDAKLAGTSSDAAGPCDEENGFIQHVSSEDLDDAAAAAADIVEATAAAAAAAAVAAAAVAPTEASGYVPPELLRHGSDLSRIPSQTAEGCINYARWREKYVKEYQGGLYIAYNGKHHEKPPSAVTVSEATGYGLLVSVLQRNRADFDGFLRFWRLFLTEHGLMYWQLLNHDGVIKPNRGSLNSATDGDMDIAFALFLAADAWDEPAYEAEAQAVCKSLLARCHNSQTQLLTLGDWCVPGHPLHDAARPSDFLLSHLTMFLRRDFAHAETWEATLEATVRAVQAQLDQHSTGLMADFVMYNHDLKRFEPVKGKVLERAHDPDYFFNSCRIPWRLSIYYMETRDPRVEPTLRALTAFFEGQDVLYAGYTLAGKSLVRYSHLGFTAPVHCLFKVMKSSHVGRVTDMMTAMGEGTYFGDTIQLLCALQTASLDARPS